MTAKMLFIIGAPRSGTTMLERMLSSHSMIQGGPEPHILTPLAYTGYWDKVTKAPYDYILSSLAQRSFVENLPNKEQDYWDACRAYCDVLYSRHLLNSSKPICLDKTPAYALILPFLTKVYPDAKYIVLTRHPAAIFSSFANSFFDGDFKVAHEHEYLLNNYVPAIAGFLKQDKIYYFHLPYESLVKDPEKWMHEICTYIDIPFESNTVIYGNTQPDPARKKGLGDPVGVNKHSKPSTGSVDKWVEELKTDASKLEFMKKIIAQLNPNDLEVIGYSLDTFWEPLKKLNGKENEIMIKKEPINSYRLQRKLIVYTRKYVQKIQLLRSVIKKIQLTCDVLLRE